MQVFRVQGWEEWSFGSLEPKLEEARGGLGGLLVRVLGFRFRGLGF